MKQRTTNEKMNRMPVKVILGDGEYELYPKNLLQVREWKVKALPIVNKLEAVFGTITKATSETETIEMSDVFTQFKSFLFQDMDSIIDLIFDWEPELPKEKILSSADELEMLEAFKEVLALAFPFLQTIGIDLKSVSLNTLLQNTDGPSTTSTA